MPDKNPNNFQSSSFIPREQDSKPKSRRVNSDQAVGVLSKVSVGILVLALLLAGASFFYVQYLESDLADKKQQIFDAQAAFDTSVIDELEDFDKRLSAVDETVSDHKAITPIFGIIEANTLAAVQLTSLTISTQGSFPASYIEEQENQNNSAGTPPEGVGPGPGGAGATASTSINAAPQQIPDRLVPVSLSGVTDTYASVVLQAQALSDNEIIKNPELSNFALNEQGRVTFSINFMIPQQYVGYEQIFEQGESTEPRVNAGSNSPQS